MLGLLWTYKWMNVSASMDIQMNECYGCYELTNELMLRLLWTYKWFNARATLDTNEGLLWNYKWINAKAPMDLQMNEWSAVKLTNELMLRLLWTHKWMNAKVIVDSLQWNSIRLLHALHRQRGLRPHRPHRPAPSPFSLSPVDLRRICCRRRKLQWEQKINFWPIF